MNRLPILLVLAVVAATMLSSTHSFGQDAAYQTVEVRGNDHTLGESPGAPGAGTIATSTRLSAGLYVMAIVGGPGVKYSSGDQPRFGVGFKIVGADMIYGGLFGLVNVRDSRTYHIFEAPNNTDVYLYFTDSTCSDNSGSLSVGILKLR